MVWKFYEIWKSYEKQGPEGPKFCEILSHSVRYGMYAVLAYKSSTDPKYFESKWSVAWPPGTPFESTPDVRRLQGNLNDSRKLKK